MKLIQFPVNNHAITSKYGWRTLNGTTDFHSGWDFVSNESAKVYAIADGVITFDMDNYNEALRWVDGKHSAGNYLIIQHNLFGKVHYARYFHLGVNTKKVGDTVKMGEYIGDYGDYGFSFGPHLHLDIWDEAWSKNEHGVTRIDPATIFYGGVS